MLSLKFLKTKLFYSLQTLKNANYFKTFPISVSYKNLVLLCIRNEKTIMKFFLLILATKWQYSVLNLLYRKENNNLEKFLQIQTLYAIFKCN